MWQKFLHKTLKVPYKLHYHEYRRPAMYRATIILLHGLGSSTSMWRSVARKLPMDVRIIAIDLLGFGASNKPSWNTYDVRMQADSIATTLFGLRVSGPLIVVGHSLGALVAIEFARRYKFMTKSIVMISPPLYKPDRDPKRFGPKPEEIIRSAFKLMTNRPADTEHILRVASKYRLINPGFVAENINVAAYLGTLEAAIVNQSSFNDIQKIKIPVHIISGSLDVLVLDTTLRELTETMPNTAWKRVVGGHEIVGLVRAATVRAIKQASDEATRQPAGFYLRHFPFSKK